MQSLLQTALWAEFKARHGWKTHEVVLADRERSILALERVLPFGKSLLYAPEVSLENLTAVELAELVTEAKKLSNSAIFFRLELMVPLGESESSLVAALTQAGFRKAFEETQPEHRQWLDISGDETAILALMSEKGRYNIRLAERKGVVTRISTDTKDVEVFYELFAKTATRNGFTIRSKEYFVDLCQTLFERNYAELIIAEAPKEAGGVALSALLITYYDGLASYLYGASSDEQRNLMGPYAAHWKAMLQAKKHNCMTYDLLQIAPANARDSHPYTNLTRFKQQFGGKRVDLIGGWDYVLEPLWYQAFKTVEQVRRK